MYISMATFYYHDTGINGFFLYNCKYTTGSISYLPYEGGHVRRPVLQPATAVKILIDSSSYSGLDCTENLALTLASSIIHTH